MRLDAVNICGLLCGLIWWFVVVKLCQWLAADVWNVNCWYLIASLNNYVINLCSSEDLELLFWCKVLHAVEPGQATWSNKNATRGPTSAWHVNWPGHCNTLDVKHAFGIGIAWAQAALIILEHEHLKFHLSDCLYHICLLLNALHMPGFTCDLCIKCLWDLRSTLNMFRLSHGTTLVLMTWTHLASKSWL